MVFVFAVTEVSELLYEDHDVSGLARAALIFVPIYWTWVSTSFYANTHDLSGAGARLALFSVALSGLFMALAVPEAFGERGVLFGASYLVGRAILTGLLLSGERPTLTPITVGLIVTGPLLFAGGFASGTMREGLWALAAVLDLSTPTLFQSRLRDTHYDPEHLTERFGLFLIIAIGESVVASGAPAAAGQDLTVGVAAAVAVAFVFACGLWWVYFQFPAGAMRYALATARVQLDVTRHVLTYAHLALIGGVIAVAVGMREVIAGPDHRLDPAAAGLLFGGCALYLATFGYTRWVMFRLVSTTRLTTAAVVLGLLPLTLPLPALLALALLAAALVALNAFEYQWAPRIGWQARLDRRQLRRNDAAD